MGGAEPPIAELRAHDSSNRAQVALHAFKTDPQARPGARIPIQFGHAPMLRRRQVKAAIMIEIADRGASSFTPHDQPAFLGRDFGEVAVTVPSEPETAACVKAAFRGGNRKKVLRQEKIFAAVAVQISHRYAKNGRHLRHQWERPGFKVVTSVQEQHRIHGGRLHLPHRR